LIDVILQIAAVSILRHDAGVFVAPKEVEHL
jgi:hypothetical protein